MLIHELLCIVSFWWENEIAFVILLQCFSENVLVVETSYKMSEVFFILGLEGAVLTFISEDNSDNYFSEKKVQFSFSGMSVF